MRFTRKLAMLGLLAVAGAFAAPGARAFTIEGQSTDQKGVPKFDLEEQAKNFRKGGVDTSMKSDGSTPFAGGTLHFGVNNSTFGPGMLGPSNRNTRQDFERMLTPESLR
jgi:hypothetical protein